MGPGVKRQAQPCSSSQPSKIQKVVAENVVPIQTVQLLAQSDGNSVASALASSQSSDGASAKTRGRVIAKHWGVHTPDVAPQMPADDALLSAGEVLNCVKHMAAYVVTTLPAFFKDCREQFKDLGFEVQDDMCPGTYNALMLPTSDSALVLCDKCTTKCLAISNLGWCVDVGWVPGGLVSMCVIDCTNQASRLM